MKVANSSEVIELFYEGMESERIVEPTSEEARLTIKSTIAGWRQEADEHGVPITVGYVTGGYDVAHLNHYWYLMNVRKEVARGWCENGGLDWDELSQDAKRILFASDVIRLVVGVDGDKLLDDRKGNKPHTGSVPRPIYPWEVRARDVAAMTFTLSTLQDGSGRFCRPIADLVTAQDPFKFADTEFTDKFRVVEALQPDVWCVFMEQWEVTRAQFDSQANPDCKLTQITDGDTFVHPVTGIPFGTSALVKLIRGNA